LHSDCWQLQQVHAVCSCVVTACPNCLLSRHIDHMRYSKIATSSIYFNYLTMDITVRLTCLVFLCLPCPVPAPVPRCSPFIFINKLAEWSNIWSDSNPYFPVPPCEYGGPLGALGKGDLRSVFVTNQPLNIPLHNLYEFVWLLKTGFPRMVRILGGKEPFIYDTKILKEGYEHSTPYIRTDQIGHSTVRRPEIIDNKNTYKAVLGSKVGQLVREGPDRFPTAYTPQGQLPGRRAGDLKTRVFIPSRHHQGDLQALTSNFHKLPKSASQRWSPVSSPVYRALSRR